MWKFFIRVLFSAEIRSSKSNWFDVKQSSVYMTTMLRSLVPGLSCFEIYLIMEKNKCEILE